MSKITSHILDVSIGLPAADVEVILFAQTADGWKEIARARTNADGRVADLAETGPGVYQLRFETQAWFASRQVASFYPFVEVSFETRAEPHYHIPLLLSPWGYTTYRGS